MASLSRIAGRALLWSFLLLGTAFPSASRAEISVAPTSILFDGKFGTRAITITNSGAREEVFRISLINLRVLSDGRVVSALIPQPGEHFAADLVRFSPREIALAPHDSQVIRFQVSSAPPGEYRTHVLVQQVPDTGPLETPPFLRADGVAIDLRAVFGVAIPLLIRSGELPVTIRFSQARIERLADGTLTASLRLERSGARSVRGGLWLRQDGREIAFYDGIAIYSPGEYRDLLLPLPWLDPGALRAGSLEVEFSEDEDTRDAVAAKAVIQLP